MSAAVAMALKASESRKFARQPISVPLDVIVLRSGVPENLPGRCLDLSEAGLGAMVAGELAAGQQVAIELRLPDVGLPLRARALVRYQSKLRCGLEFVGLPREQQELIYFWAQRALPRPIPVVRSEVKIASVNHPVVVSRSDSFSRFRGLTLTAGVLLLIAAAAAGYWHWQHSWHELETDVYAGQETLLRVPAETMEQRIISKAEPIYPEQARQAGRQGLAVLDAVIGEDGSVEQVNAISGDALLAKAAAEAVRQWKFEAYQFSGRATRVETTIAVEFQLN